MKNLDELKNVKAGWENGDWQVREITEALDQLITVQSALEFVTKGWYLEYVVERGPKMASGCGVYNAQHEWVAWEEGAQELANFLRAKAGVNA